MPLVAGKAHAVVFGGNNRGGPKAWQYLLGKFSGQQVRCYSFDDETGGMLGGATEIDDAFGHVLASDSARSLVKVGKELANSGIPHVCVVHKKKNFAKVVHLPMTSLKKRLRDRVAKLPTSTPCMVSRTSASGHCHES